MADHVTTNNNYARWLYALVVLLTIIAAAYLLGWAYGILRACSNILALYFAAWLLQFFFTPVVDFLTRRRLPRVLAVAYVYLLLTLALVILVLVSAPILYSQVQRLANTVADPHTATAIQSTAQGIERFLEHNLGVPRKDIADFTKNYSVNLRNGAFHAGQHLQSILRNYVSLSNLASSTSAFLSFVNTIQGLLLNFVIVLILAFYMTLDGHKIARRVLSYFPPAVGEVMESVSGIINRKFGGYLRGQVILAASYGVLTFLIAQGFDLRLQVFIAIFAAVVMLIPFIGTFLAIVPPIAGFILVHAPDHAFPWSTFALLLLFLIASQQIVIYFLSPRVMGSAMGMHPLLVVLGVLLGTKIAGLWGAIFGVPVFGVVVETADLVYRRVMDRRYGFQPPAADASDNPSGVGAASAEGAGPARAAEQGSGAGRPALPKASASLQAPRPRDTRA